MLLYHSPVLWTQSWKLGFAGYSTVESQELNQEGSHKFFQSPSSDCEELASGCKIECSAGWPTTENGGEGGGRRNIGDMTYNDRWLMANTFIITKIYYSRERPACIQPYVTTFYEVVTHQLKYFLAILCWWHLLSTHSQHWQKCIVRLLISTQGLLGSETEGTEDCMLR